MVYFQKSPQSLTYPQVRLLGGDGITEACGLEGSRPSLLFWSLSASCTLFYSAKMCCLGANQRGKLPPTVIQKKPFLFKLWVSGIVPLGGESTKTSWTLTLHWGRTWDLLQFASGLNIFHEYFVAILSLVIIVFCLFSCESPLYVRGTSPLSYIHV